MLALEKITTPTLLIDQDKARQHIQAMVQKANQQNIRLRPHFKTHQSAAIGEWFRQAGISQITCSSVQMADYFARHGWKDILIAFPVNLREIASINKLAESIHLELLVKSASSANILSSRMKQPVDIWVEVDSGAKRTGIPAGNYQKAAEVCNLIQESPVLNLRGLLTHAGNTYRSGNAIQAVGTYQASVTLINQLRNSLKKFGISELEISVGDTPGCTLAEDLGIVDEIRPGNFVFFDASQAALGTCQAEEIAVAVACPVVSVQPEQEKIVVYGGTIHLSSENYVQNDHKVYGLPAFLEPDGWGKPVPGAYVSSLYQEHGIIHMPEAVCNTIQPGDLLAILPVHSCITISCMKKYLTLEGEILTTLNCEEG